LARRFNRLGLDVPEGVAITVGGTTVEWREGKVITFDDSHRHSVEQNATAIGVCTVFWFTRRGLIWGDYQ
jgi:aspartyl/asparaginyl beta-hydroxylase (cupin superfamily)